MKIRNLRKETNDSKVRVAATISWEDCDRPTHEVYFETEEKFSASLTCDPHAFLVGCAIPAMHFGEQRLSIDADICPELRRGVTTAMTWLRHWFYDPGQPLVRIEAGVRSGISEEDRLRRAGFFFSGGIDSFATLRANRLQFPLQHPGAIKDGILILGLEQDDPEIFRQLRSSLSGIAEAAGVTLIPVYTNVYLNYRQEDAAQKFKFWAYEFQAAALSAVAHALSLRLATAYIPASDSIPNDAFLNKKHVDPFGTHPLIDMNYSSAELKIQHDGITMSRLEKTRLVADWDEALRHLRVCNRYKKYPAGALNCGRCEKCLRTMLALKIVGRLDNTSVFPANDLLGALHAQKSLNPYYYLEMLPHLREMGLDELAQGIERKITRYRLIRRMKSWRERLQGLAGTTSRKPPPVRKPDPGNR